MTKGQECPYCGQQTFHDRNTHRECSACGYVGWPWYKRVSGMGRGSGRKCPWCEAATLHAILTLPSGATVRRCSTCSFTAIEPPD